MKKYLLILLSVFAFAATQAQYYQPYHILMLDQNMDTLYDGNLIAVQNTDSSGTSTDFHKYYPYPAGPVIHDSVLVPAGYSGNLISFYYSDCNGYQHYDTSFTPGVQLNVVLIANCSNPCDADFSYQIGPNRNVAFMPTNYSSAYVHRWYFGDGNMASTYNPQHQYAAPGSYQVWHVVENSVISCYDSSLHTVAVYDSCFVDFSYTMDSLTTVTFTSTVFPVSSNVYWDFGDGASSTQANPVHTFPSQTNYQVILYVYGAGCQDSIVKNVQVNGSFLCSAQVNKTNTAPFVVYFERVDSSAGYPEWRVNNSVVSTAHSYNYVASGPGSEDVFLYVKDSAGNIKCSSQHSVYFNKCGTQTQPHGVGGTILFDSTFRVDYDSLIVYLIGHDTAAGTLTLIDSLILTNSDSAFYLFSVCDANYNSLLIKAALLPGSSLYADYIPTYHERSALWSGADAVGLGSWSNDINMIGGNNPGGPGFIGGYVSQGANKSGDALDGIQVLLLNASNEPVASTHTANAGRYEFSNLAYGTYQVLVEIPGKPSAVYTVVLTSDNPSSDDNDFEVNKDNISIVNSIAAVPASVGRLYPNPVAETLTLEWTAEADEELTLVFIGMDGKVLEKQSISREGASSSNVQVKHLPQGNLILRIEGEKTLSVYRIWKQ